MKEAFLTVFHFTKWHYHQISRDWSQTNSSTFTWKLRLMCLYETQQNAPLLRSKIQQYKIKHIWPFLDNPSLNCLLGSFSFRLCIGKSILDQWASVQPLILQPNHRHVGAKNERMQSMNHFIKAPGLCIAEATTLPQAPCEETAACVQPDLIVPAYGVLSGKLFHKTWLCDTLLHFLIATKYGSTTEPC